MGNDSDSETSRREFLLAGTSIAVGAALAGCAPEEKSVLPAVTDIQRSHRRQGKSTVVIQRCLSYEEKIVDLIAPWVSRLDRLQIKNRKIFLKVNMVDFYEGRPLTTNPAMIEALIDVLAGLGAASIQVGDGPALNRDTDYLLSATGIGACCQRKKVQFVDLNIDDLDKVDNVTGFTRLEHFLLPRSIVTADLVVSMPKLKTHRWSRFTASMKNLFGVVPGRRYGWPKSLLHQCGVDNSIMDLVATVKPALCVVDAVTAMEGEGPLSGDAINSGFIVIGEDPAAVDSVCARAIGIDPDLVKYLLMAEQVIGNIRLNDILLEGDSLESVTRKFRLPARFNQPLNAAEARRQSEFGAT